jgi:aspartyl-tRNA(Asn)/glutamyl-tRNA(Gln) amidotransferase subunit C
LDKLDSSAVPPTAHPFFSKTVWRDDRVVPWQETESILVNAPEREESYFKVKKVIE